jgi:hypothetical protein
VGESPLQYQWIKDGSLLSDATNSVLLFDPIQIANAGTYSLLVSNHHGTVLSVPAVVSVTSVTGGGVVTINTYTNNAPTYDVDGMTLLDDNFKVQIYAGAGPNILHSIGEPASYESGGLAGFIGFHFPLYRVIPDVPAGQTAYVQLRAWEAAFGSSYEQARAAGGKFGFSKVFPTLTTSSGRRVLTESFTLRAGEPFFVAGRLAVGERLPNGTRQYTLTGEVGARYLVESRQPPNNWVPFMVLTNIVNPTIFSDPEQNHRPVQFYRARILD